MRFWSWLFACVTISSLLWGKVDLGVDCFFREGGDSFLQGKRVALLMNHTSYDSSLKSTEELFLEHANKYKLVALFAPEHGLHGLFHAEEAIVDSKSKHNIHCYSLFGKHRRPTEAMLKDVDVIVCDLQDIGVRSYTYVSTLFYVMEEAAKLGIEVVVLDRPNPLGGLLVDGPMLEEAWRSFIGYVNVPYCHGLTIGELARFFNGEYRIGCKLRVVKMRGWERKMTFEDTGLSWIPTSPNIPEPDTPLFYASTGILGVLNFVNIGGGINLPYKIVGAPWVNADELADKLNKQKLPGVVFVPFHYRPYYGAMKGKDCHGVQIVVRDKTAYRPLMVQYMMIGVLKSLYPHEFKQAVRSLKNVEKELFCKANGNRFMLDQLSQETYISWSLIGYQEGLRQKYLNVRSKYLLY
ncbi:MAG: DUF1343 domain-containing protein [Simkania sp.]|nr:DUF1343 domain-containing protein [Simkania sp.]